MNTIKLSPLNLRKGFTFVLLLLISLFLILAFHGGNVQNQAINLSALKAVPETAWIKLSQQRILFGHQSVGYNIVQGIQELLKENPQIKLNILENSHQSEVANPGFIHFPIGRNTDPQSKIDGFANLMKQDIGKTADIAFFKLCFVDFSSSTDVSKVFSAYQTTMDALVQQFPKTTFVHVTVPLTSQPNGLKKLLKGTKKMFKQLVNQPSYDISDNKQKNEFNDLLKNTYQGKAPIFDIAGIESTFLDGKQQVYSSNGKSYLSLVPDYTYDGGHLNELGRKVVAEKLLVFLAKLSQSSSPK
jgi:hypothetical protein